ncbi:MAG TPA: AAA family ATPase [Roseiflexaceae bacterium]|nr:AAA family ATPase [Roseiflexaceae bacterium]
MLPTLRMRLLGDFSLAYGGRPVAGVGTARVQALLAYLALHRDAPQPRQHLAFLFWPDSSEAQARNNLRQAIYQIRHTLPDADCFVHTDAATVCWRAESPFSLDVADFQEALAAADALAGAEDPVALAAALERAANLYQDDLLPGCYDDWIAPERDRLREQYLRTLDRLVALLEEQGDYPAAIRHAQRLLRHDQLREDTYLTLMRLHTRNDDRAGALRVYHACATLLERELGVEPGPAIRAAHARLLRPSQPAAPPPPPSATDLPIETVTFLFTDVEGSTRLWERHPAAMRQALSRHDALIESCVAQHGGVVVRPRGEGDSRFAVFARATDALAAAVAIQRALHAEPWTALGQPLRVRIALHTGEADLRDGDYYGSAVNRCARLRALARGGQTLLSQTTHDLVRDHPLPASSAAGEPPQLRDLGSHRLKDLRRPEQVYQLVIPGLPDTVPPFARRSVQPTAQPTLPAARPILSALAPLVGRRAEWEQLQSAWQDTLAGGPRLALLAGEAGVGKSRLAEELLLWAGQEGAVTARTRAYAAEGRLSYAPVTEWLRSESLRPALDKLAPVWLTDVARLLPELLSEHPELPRPEPLTEYWQRQRFFEALAHAVLASGRPLLLLLDDLQWCDQETLEWLHFLLRFDPRARLLVVGTARAEEVGAQHPLNALLLALRVSGQAVELELGRLHAGATAALAGHMLGQAVDEQQAQRLYQETEGNPLFVVETIRAGLQVREAGRANGSASASVAAPTPAAARTLPPKVHAVIAARLTQLSTEAGALARLAATVGRAFSFEVLARASERDEDSLVRALDELWQRRIVREQGTSSYDFSHDKIREVAYAQVSPIQRRTLHRRVAQALESIHAADLDPVSAQVAAHYEQAGMPERAIGHYQRAASVAQRIYANEEAIALLDRGLALLAALPPGPGRDERELAMQTALGPSLVANAGYGSPRTTVTYHRALALCEQLGRPSEPPILRALAISQITHAEFERAYELGAQLLAIGERSQDAVRQVEGHYVLGVTLFWQGEFARSRDHLEAAIAHYDPKQSSRHIARYSQDPKVVCLCRLAFTLWYLGYPDQALQTFRESLTLAHELAHPFSLAYAQHFGTYLFHHRRAFDEMAAQVETLTALTREHRLHLMLQHAAIYHGWVLGIRGALAAGIAQMRETLEIFYAEGNHYQRAYFLAMLAELYAKAGEVEQGLAALGEGLALVEHSGERWCEAVLHRTSGELLLLKGDDGGAEAAFQRALSVARAQEARSPELRAATSLARLRLRQGRQEQARAVLEPVYAWFTEGFETLDLREARAVLEEIRASSQV